jgi:acetyl esterase/lipase
MLVFYVVVVVFLCQIDTAPRIPPMMVFSGTNDLLTPVEDARYFYDELQQYRVAVREKSKLPVSTASVSDVFVELPGAHHGYHIVSHSLLPSFSFCQRADV